MELTKSDQNRFWKKVDIYGPVPEHAPDLGNCWIWKAGVCGNGYGGFPFRDRTISAHRVAWMIKHGEIPVGMQVLHSCDNPLCVRHLFLGSHKDNMRDMAEKGRAATGDRHMSRTHPERLGRGLRNGKYTKPERTPRGEKHGIAKLTELDVRAIRARHVLARPSNSHIAKDYGVTTALIRFIVRGEIWRHVT